MVKKLDGTLDIEWIGLIAEALRLGLSPIEIAHFLKSKNRMPI